METQSTTKVQVRWHGSRMAKAEWGMGAWGQTEVQAYEPTRQPKAQYPPRAKWRPHAPNEWQPL